VYAARTAGALEVFTVDLRSATYKRTTGALDVFIVDPRSGAYKQTSRDPETVIGP